MTTATQEKDEDLIILSDDSLNDNSILDFNFDVNKSEDSNLTTDSIMNFGNDTKTEDISFDIDLGTETTTSQQSSENISFGDDLFDLGTETTVSNDLDILDIDATQENNTIVSENSDIDFGFGEETSKEEEKTGIVDELLTSDVSNKNEIIEPSIVLQQEKTSNNVINNVIEESFDRNDILEEAILKMQTRKEIIGQTKTSKQSKVDELNEQIKNLKKEVSDFESEIKNLEKESLALDLDISSIEKMKTTIGEISNDRQRKHNLDNIKKK